MIAQWRTATVLFVKELARRWPTVVFMLALPAAYFVVSYATSSGAERVPLSAVVRGADAATEVRDRDVEALYLAVLGATVAGSFGALTAVRGSTAFLRRLRSAGYRAGALLAGRLAVLLVVTVVSAAFFVAMLAPLVALARPAAALVAVAEVALIAVALGATVGSLVTRELEAAMAVVAVSGVQLALGRSGSDAEQWLLYTPAVDALKSAAFTDAAVAASLLRGATYAVVLFGLAYACWAVRTRRRGVFA